MNSFIRKMNEEEDNTESVWVEIIYKNDEKIRLGNFSWSPLMEAQNGLEASLFQEIRKVVEGNNLVVVVGDFNYPDINWCDRRYTSPTSGNFIDFCEDFFKICMLRKEPEGETL